MYHLMGEALMFGTFCNTDVSAPLGDRKYNRCDTNLSLSGRLCLRVLKHVLLHPSIPFFSRAHYCRSSIDPVFSKSNTGASKTKWDNPVPISLNQIEVAVDTAYEQYPPSQTKLGMGAQQGDKPHELSVGSDLECAIETPSGLQIPAAVATVQRGRGYTQVRLGTAV
jgi:hypothetical protein